MNYAIRIPANDALLRDIAEFLARPVGRPSNKLVVWYKVFLYPGESWKTARRVVEKSGAERGGSGWFPGNRSRDSKQFSSNGQERSVGTGLILPGPA